MQVPNHIHTPRQIVIVSLLLGFYASSGSTALGLLAMAAIEALRPYWQNFALVTLAIGLSVFAGYGARQLLTAYPPPDLRALVALVDQTQAASQASRAIPTNAQLHAAAAEILSLHCIEGLAATREECSARGISQTDWNLINRCLQAAGLKSARAWQVDDLQDALSRWRAQVHIGEDLRIWVKPHPGSNTSQRID